jgi:hypothetical protein
MSECLASGCIYYVFRLTDRPTDCLNSNLTIKVTNEQSDWLTSDPSLFKNFPALYGTCIFVPMITTDRYLSLSWARLIQFLAIYRISSKYNFKLYFHLRLGLPSVCLSFRFPNQNPLFISLWRQTCYMHNPLHPRSIGRFHSSAAQIKNNRSEWRPRRPQSTVVTLCDGSIMLVETWQCVGLYRDTWLVEYHSGYCMAFAVILWRCINYRHITCQIKS